MKALFLDLSGAGVRYLVVEHGRATMARSLEIAVTGPDDVPGLLARIGEETGCRFDQAHLVAAHRDVAADSFKLQEMPLGDARQVIQRRLELAGGEGGAPVLHLLAMRAERDQRIYLAEQLPRQTVARYFDAFAGGGIRLRTVTSPLQAALAAVAPLREEMLQPHAVIGVERDAVTILVLSSSEVLYTARAELPASDDEAERDAPERARRRRLFGILNVLHGLYSQYMLDHPQGYLGKAWLFGADAGLDGLAGSLAEAMDVEVAAIELPAGTGVDNPHSFVALGGLLRVYDDAQRVNFLPEEMTRSRWRHPRVAGFTLVAAGIMLLVLVVVTMEFRISRRSQALTTARQELQTLENSARRTEALARNLDLLGKLAAEQPQLHAILRELAANLPETVFLDAVHYNRLADRGILELVTVTDSAVALGEDQALSAIVNTVRRSPRLALDNDPVIAMVKEGERRLVQVTVVCTVVPPGGSDR